MAKFLRNIYAFNCSPLVSKVGGIGVLGASFQFCKYFSSGGGSSKLDGTYSHDENMPEKELALEQALGRITGLSRKGPTTCLNNLVFRKNIPVISTGSFALDMALGAGGLPKGRIVEIYGPEASGKTTLSLHVIAEAQKQGGYCLYVDAEHALDPALAEAIGVETENLLLSQPKCGEQALSLVNTFIQKGAVDVIVVDSVAALVPQRELDGEKGDDNMTLQARLMNQALRKLQQSLAFSETILIFINQYQKLDCHSDIAKSKDIRSCRSDKNTFFDTSSDGHYVENSKVRTKPSKFKGLGGWTEVTCGGNALKFYATVRLNIKRMGLIRRGDQIIGSQVQVKVVKNKLTAPLTTSESKFELEFGKGIRQEAEITELALQNNLITKEGPYYCFNNEKFNGEDSLKRFLSRNNVAREELVMKLREKLFAPTDQETCNADSRKEIAASASRNE